eukprot:2011802-Rhodomonas_salina.5
MPPAMRVRVLCVDVLVLHMVLCGLWACWYQIDVRAVMDGTMYNVGRNSEVPLTLHPRSDTQ